MISAFLRWQTSLSSARLGAVLSAVSIAGGTSGPQSVCCALRAEAEISPSGAGHSVATVGYH